METGRYLDAGHDFEGEFFRGRARFLKSAYIIVIGHAQDGDAVFRRHLNERRRRIVPVGAGGVAVQIDERHKASGFSASLEKRSSVIGGDAQSFQKRRGFFNRNLKAARLLRVIGDVRQETFPVELFERPMPIGA